MLSLPAVTGGWSGSDASNVLRLVQESLGRLPKCRIDLRERISSDKFSARWSWSPACRDTFLLLQEALEGLPKCRIDP